MAELRALLDDPARSAGLSAKQRAARERAARERQERVAAAIARLPALEARQAKLGADGSRRKDKRAGKLREPRASTTDADARVMKMPDGGFRPAVNVQFAVDTASRAVVGVAVVNAGVDTRAGRADARAGRATRRAARWRSTWSTAGTSCRRRSSARRREDVTLFVPPKPPRNTDKRGSEFEPRPGDSEAVRAWRARMGSEAGQADLQGAGVDGETVNADLKAHRGGLARLAVRGLDKAQCVALWLALAYNVLHFAAALIG